MADQITPAALSTIGTSALASPVTAAAPWWLRLHQALMPDYNRRAAAYWWTMVSLGSLCLAYSLWQVSSLAPDVLLQVLVGCAVAMLAGFYPVRVPGSNNSFVAGEIFVFLLLLLHGPAAAVLASAGEAFVGSARNSKRWTSRLVSPALASIAMGACGVALHKALALWQGLGLYNEAMLLLSVMAFAMAYFLLNTVLITVIPQLKRNERVQLRGLIGNFGWVGITYSASSLVAGLLFLTFKTVGLPVLMAAVPIIVMLLSMLHIYFRKRELDEAASLLRVQTAEREAQQSARHLAELQASERRFHSAFANAAIGMALISTTGRVLQVNPAMCALLGRTEAELNGCDFADFVHADDTVSLAQRLVPAEHGGVAVPIELRCKHAQGREVWISTHAGFFTDRHANMPCLILQAQDISARRQAESQLQHIAYHDSLTGLPNRTSFSNSLAQAIARCASNRRHSFALMYLDFDRFKLINDTRGHSAGDDFLIAVAQRIREQVRPTDTVGRLGGDEFAILIEGFDDTSRAEDLALRLQAALQRPFLVDGAEINTSASIGITFSSVGYASPGEVLRDADIAMYRAKAAGRGRHVLFDVALRKQLSDQVQLEADLRHAIDNDQLDLAYQPIFDLDNGNIIGFEALARWAHPARGPISPQVFVPLAEESGLIGALTERVLAKACSQLKIWQESSPQHTPLGMQVNLSGADLGQGALALHVATTLLTLGVDAAHLTLEITEGKLMTRLDGSLDTLMRLRDIGVGISVDDFGTGYSSLAYLSSLPISSLKIDRSFIKQMMSDEQDAEIVKAVIGLGGALGKTVIAEGIETPAQLSQLRALGCRFGQGFLLSPPLEPGVALQMLQCTPPAAPLPIAVPLLFSDTESAALH